MPTTTHTHTGVHWRGLPATAAVGKTDDYHTFHRGTAEPYKYSFHETALCITKNKPTATAGIYSYGSSAATGVAHTVTCQQATHQQPEDYAGEDFITVCSRMPQLQSYCDRFDGARNSQQTGIPSRRGCSREPEGGSLEGIGEEQYPRNQKGK